MLVEYIVSAELRLRLSEMSTHPLSSPKSHSQRSPADPDIRTQTPTHDSPSEPEEEARPSHTAEIGTLKKLSVPGGTAWLGSSSGVYFVNTVRRAFSAAFAANSNSVDDNSDPETVPASEDIITGEDAAGRSFDGGTNTNGRNAWWLHDADFHRRIVAAVGRPPADQRLAMDLVTTFFRTTHPLFPFLHGPKFLEDVNEIYAALAQQSTQPSQTNNTGKSATTAPRPKRTNSATSINSTFSNLGNIQSVDPLKLITFQIIINIAGLSHGTTPAPVPALPASSTIPSAQALLTLILPLSTTPLIPTIQLLLSAELYLLSTISLRHSSTLAGVVLRLIYHTGLHRCPLRYASLTPQDCEIRKRVFWSAYALDRHLSLALGDPNTFQDSDIDVCLSRDGDGEMHRAVARDLLTEEEKEDEMRLHYPRDGSGKRVLLVDSGTQRPPQRVGMNDNTSDNTATGTGTSTTSTKHPPNTTSQDSTTNSNEPTLSPRSKQLREAALTAYVHYGKLTGRIIEIFHKSINFRFPKEDAIGFLSADIENWWNDLPSTLTGDHHASPSSSTTPTAATGTGTGTETDADRDRDIDPALVAQHKLLTPFFTLLYHQLLLLLNRPRLSLDQSSAPFQEGLQVCIRASRATLTSLTRHRQNGQSMFLPGLLSAAWMSGLIIAFACQLGKYPKNRACSDMRGCLGILESMNVKWYTVRNCHKVLSLLLGNIMGRKAGSNGHLPAGRTGGDGNVDGAQGQGQGLGMGSGSGSLSHQGAGVKRTRDSFSLENSEAEPSPKRDSLAGVSPASSDFRPQRYRRSSDTRSNNRHINSNFATTAQPNSHNIPTASFFRDDSTMSNASFDFSNQPPSSAFRSMNFNNTNSGPTINSTNDVNAQQRAGAALYADPQDMAFAQSNHSMGLADMSSMDDQMFWGNMDSNLFDVFGAVSWENMTGPIGPMASNPNVWDMSAFANPGGGSDGNISGGGRFM